MQRNGPRHFTAYSLTTLFYVGIVGLFYYFETTKYISTKTVEITKQDTIQMSLSTFVPEVILPPKPIVKPIEKPKPKPKLQPMVKPIKKVVPKKIVAKKIMKPKIVKKKVPKKVTKKVTKKVIKKATTKTQTTYPNHAKIYSIQTCSGIFCTKKCLLG
ncbi:MAG: hypothetical protein Q9M36_04210 [Sulfurovum sp.]|nr:hypothetical protein [Sulfurovum sp.]